MITISQHCEVTIALGARALSSPFDPPIEIGISKHSCWLCQVLFGCLESELGQKFGITGNQGKVHAGWHYPVEAGYATRNSLLKILHKELGELRGIANPRKRSDSFPVSSPAGKAGNEEHSDSEEKSTKEEIAALYASRAAEKLWPCVSYARFAKIALLAPPTPKIITELDCVSAPPFRV